MSRRLTPGTSLESLKKEAKHWLKTLRSNDGPARARLAQAHPGAPAHPTLRDAQHALAREFGFASWAHLKARLAEGARDDADPRELAVQALLTAAGNGNQAQVVDLLDRYPDTSTSVGYYRATRD
jgi:hypothetical protein